jgi:hypothetical protein
VGFAGSAAASELPGQYAANQLLRADFNLPLYGQPDILNE